MERVNSAIVEKLISCSKNNIYEKLELLWDNIKRQGTPLVETIEGDDKNVLVTFLYRSNENLESIMVYGGVPGFNYENNMLYNIENTDIWFRTFKVRNDVKFKYRFCLNYKKEFEWTDIKKNSFIDPLNPNNYVYKKDEEDPEDEDSIESFVKLPNVKEDYWTKHEKANQKGNLELHRFSSSILGNTRRVWVYKPFRYDSKKDYNLIVFLDGDLYINSLNAKELIDNLIEENKIEESICVFVASTNDRYNELTCNNDFSEFITSEVMPWIKKNYSVTKEASKTTVVGVSLGGLAVAHLGLKYSQLFGNILSQSGSFWFENGILIEKFRACDKLPLRFYLNVGLLEDRPYDNEPIMADYINPFRDLLLEKGYEVYYETFQSGHDFLSWEETLANALIALK